MKVVVTAVPVAEGLIISPADGVICSIGHFQPPPELGLGMDPMLRVCVFMNVFDVHVNRAPVTGAFLCEQHIEQGVRVVPVVDGELDEPPRVGVHRRLAQLLRVHLAQPLEALDAHLALQALRGDAVEDPLLLGVVQRVQRAAAAGAEMRTAHCCSLVMAVLLQMQIRFCIDSELIIAKSVPKSFPWKRPDL